MSLDDFTKEEILNAAIRYKKAIAALKEENKNLKREVLRLKNGEE